MPEHIYESPLSGSRDYNDGYARGLFDAQRDELCLNGHGYDPSIHRGNDDFQTGYGDGYLDYMKNYIGACG